MKNDAENVRFRSIALKLILVSVLLIGVTFSVIISVFETDAKRTGAVMINQLKVFDRNEILKTVNGMTVVDNVKTYVADASTRELIGADNRRLGVYLDDLGISFGSIRKNEVYHTHYSVYGRRSLCTLYENDDFIICVAQGMGGIVLDGIVPMAVICLFVVLAVLAFLLLVKNMLFIENRQKEQLQILKSMSGIYYSMHYINLVENTYEVFSSFNNVLEISDKNKGHDADKTMLQVMHATMSEAYLDEGLEFADVTTLRDRLKGKKVISKDLLGRNVGWIRMSFIAIDSDANGVKTVVCTTQVIESEKRKEEYLLNEAITDTLTNCYNRLAYENEIGEYINKGIPKDFTIVSMDVDGLKAINDSKGHGAGDELLLGAVECIKDSFGNDGKIFRLGGDEFVVFISCDEKKLDEICFEFDRALTGWSGENIDGLSVSYGTVARRDYPELSIRDMVSLADRKMYENKKHHYKMLGSSR
ncbi:MAG: GGDEF domain-containing protein [Eubacteriales bacterium]|nr:GGDEF domain-containing protein [Eubacteriales bacterium]